VRPFPPLVLIVALALPGLHGCGASTEGEFRGITNVDAPVEVSSGRSSDVVNDPPEPTDSPVADADSPGSADTERDSADGQPGDPDVDEAAGGRIEQVAAVDVSPGERLANVAEPDESVKTGESAENRVVAKPGESLVPAPDFKRERSGALRVTFDDLDLNRVMGIEKPTEETPADMPAWQKDLVGKRIRIRGFMKPFEFTTDLPAFPLVRDNGVCCFGPMAKLYDKVHVYLREGDTVDLQSAPLDVEGTFEIAPFSLGGELQLFYVLEDAVVIR
jgi:hypothetical protein